MTASWRDSGDLGEVHFPRDDWRDERRRRIADQTQQDDIPRPLGASRVLDDIPSKQRQTFLVLGLVRAVEGHLDLLGQLDCLGHGDLPAFLDEASGDLLIEVASDHGEDRHAQHHRDRDDPELQRTAPGVAHPHHHPADPVEYAGCEAPWSRARKGHGQAGPAL